MFPQPQNINLCEFGNTRQYFCRIGCAGPIENESETLATILTLEILQRLISSAGC